MNLRPLKASRFWNAKQGTFPREVSCEVETQPRFSLEDKGKVPLSVGSVAHTTSIQGAQSPLSREAELEPRGCESSLALPNQRELISNTKSTPLSGVKELSPSADSVAYAALAPKDTNKVFNREAGTKALCSVNYLCRGAKIKATPC